MNRICVRSWERYFTYRSQFIHLLHRTISIVARVKQERYQSAYHLAWHNTYIILIINIKRVFYILLQYFQDQQGLYPEAHSDNFPSLVSVHMLLMKDSEVYQQELFFPIKKCPSLVIFLQALLIPFIHLYKSVSYAILLP